MARKFTENPSLDMTPMIDVVFELIIFFVVTLKMAVEKDETIQLEDGRHGIELTADELPPSHLVIDIAKNEKGYLKWIVNGDFPPEARAICMNLLDGKGLPPCPDAGRAG